jgi:acyl phosphate:glycerol-3-phosphate acyltransferase
MPDITSAPLTLLIVAVLGYLLGSIPFGVIITRVMGLGDLRQIGSGNIGATNVLRTGNKGAAAATLILDGAKGAAAVLIARALYAEDAAQIAGLSAFLGHLFPVWLGFKGGKGVATFLGTLLALAWPVGIAACATWAATALVTRISSLSALVAASVSAVWAVLLGYPQIALLAALLGTLVLQRHAANIARLRAGTEPKIGKKG